MSVGRTMGQEGLGAIHMVPRPNLGGNSIFIPISPYI